MTHYIITKWVEPYVLLETAKKIFEMKDYTFDGFTKLDIKKEFLKQVAKSNAFGMYMKNVNKFYLFCSHQPIDISNFLTKEIGLSEQDFYLTEDLDEPFNMVDLGKAEAAIV